MTDNWKSYLCNVNGKLASIFVAACLLVFVSLPAFARPARAPQDQATAETQSVEKGKKQKGGEKSDNKENSDEIDHTNGYEEELYETTQSTFMK